LETISLLTVGIVRISQSQPRARKTKHTPMVSSGVVPVSAAMLQREPTPDDGRRSSTAFYRLPSGNPSARYIAKFPEGDRESR
jgi:hypothetical protein